jgi:hypothetical protein
LLAGFGCLTAREQHIGGAATDIGSPEADVVIRPGMTLNQVEKILGSMKIGMGAWRRSGPPECRYTQGLWVQYDYYDKVIACKITTFSDLNVSRVVRDDELSSFLKRQLSPSQISDRIGPPTFGFENAQGEVVLVYRQAGVAATFARRQLTDITRLRPAPTE